MKTLVEELTFERDAIKTWSIFNLFLIILGSLMMLHDKGFAGLVFVGVIDEICVIILYTIFKIKNLKAIFDTFETAGKQILFLGLYSVLACALTSNLFDPETSNMNSTVLYFLTGFAVLHILVRFFTFTDIFINIAEDHHFNVVNFFKNEPSMKYITDSHIQVPFYGVVCGEFEIVHTDLRYRGKTYNTYDILVYLDEHKKKFEDLTDVEFEMFENMRKLKEQNRS